MGRDNLELATVCINKKLLDVYYSVTGDEVEIESVEDITGATNIMEFLNTETMSFITKEVNSLVEEFA